MTNREIVNRNIGLTFDFLRQVIKNPEMLDSIPDKSTLEFVDKDFSKIEKTKRTKTKRKYMRVKSEFVVI
ncbi:MAG: hypothetical protein ABI855_14105 [Bacteroidota bacterium]